jgi:hypothetical protein
MKTFGNLCHLSRETEWKLIAEEHRKRFRQEIEEGAIVNAENSKPTGRKTADTQPTLSHFTDWICCAFESSTIVTVIQCQRNLSHFTLILLNITSSTKNIIFATSEKLLLL